MTDFDKDMMAALEADGEKLRAETGEDHGPFDINDPNLVTAAAERRVRPGSEWRHKKGGVYRVYCVAIEEATLAPVVIYFGIGPSITHWSRPLEEFLDGRFTEIG